MKILTIDIGAGTQDIMLYDSEKTLENSIKMVMPSPTVLFANKIKKISSNIYIGGEIMGGGALNKAIYAHIDKGFEVVMEETAARTVRDDLDRVRSKNITVLDDESDLDKYKDYQKLNLKDIDMETLMSSISSFIGDFEIDKVAIAVQDHGANTEMGDRDFRFVKIREKLTEPLAPEAFAFENNIPEFFTRMKAVSRTLGEYDHVIMDSKFAAICGACHDEEIAELNSFIVMDIGNGHTMAASIENGVICGLFEHHTSSLTPEKIEKLVEKLANATITHEEVHDDFGHGAFTLKPIEKIEKVVVTGPMRNIIKKTKLDYYNAAPAGDVMMTGPVGLINATKFIEKK